MAAGLIRAIREADNGTQAVGSSLPVQREAVRRSRDDLLALAQRLQSEKATSRLAVTLATELLTDVNSPLYDSRADLRAAVRSALAAFDP